MIYWYSSLRFRLSKNDLRIAETGVKGANCTSFPLNKQWQTMTNQLAVPGEWTGMGIISALDTIAYVIGLLLGYLGISSQCWKQISKNRAMGWREDRELSGKLFLVYTATWYRMMWKKPLALRRISRSGRDKCPDSIRLETSFWTQDSTIVVRLRGIGMYIHLWFIPFSHFILATFAVCPWGIIFRYIRRT